MQINRLIHAIVLLAATVALVPASLAQSIPEPTSVARSLVERYAALKTARDVTKLSEIYSESYVENTGRNPSGMAALAENWRNQFAAIPDLSIKVHDVIAGGDKVVARITYSGTHTTPFFAGLPPTGRKFTIGTIDIWRIEGGKFAEHWDQVDYAGLQRQLTSPSPKP